MRKLLVTLLVPQAGCALILNTAPPDPGELRSGDTPQCTDHYVAPVVDILLGIVAAGAGASGMIFGSMNDIEDSAIVLGAVGVAGGIVHFISAGVGIQQVGTCRDLRADSTSGFRPLGEHE